MIWMKGYCAIAANVILAELRSNAFPFSSFSFLTTKTDIERELYDFDKNVKTDIFKQCDVSVDGTK